jgi:hypothetical protein
MDLETEKREGNNITPDESRHVTAVIHLHAKESQG